MPIHEDDDFDPEDAGPASADDLTAADAALLDRFLAGESSPEDDEMVRRRFGDDLRPRMLAALGATERAANVDTMAAWRAVQARTTGASVSNIVTARRQGIWKSTGFRIAASLLVLAGAGALARQVSTYRQRLLSERVVQTATGERRDVVLPDSTRVTMAPKSRLAYPAAFAVAQRDVQLTGEAFFSVAHDARHPFVVHTAGATARVLGTEFGVRARSGQSVNVYVASGRVLVAPPRDSAGPVLLAGDLGRVDVGAARGQVVVTHNISMDDYLAWRDGRIVATSQPAAQVLDELGRWYDASFSIPDSALASRSVSVDLRVGNGASLDSVLDALMLTLDARYVRNGSTITVRPR